MRCSDIFSGMVKSADFEPEAADSPVRKFFAEVEAEKIYKGNLQSKETVKVFIGGKTIYQGKTYNVCSDDLPVQKRGLFFLSFLMPDERDFTSGVSFFLDVFEIIENDSVMINHPEPKKVSLSELSAECDRLNAKYDPKKIVQESDALVAGTVRATSTRRLFGGRLEVTVTLDTVQTFLGDSLTSPDTVRFNDFCRRIHYRHRKRTDVPFYILNDPAAARRENSRNFFIGNGDTLLFCLKKKDNDYTVNADFLGLFQWRGGEISSRFFLGSPVRADDWIKDKEKSMNNENVDGQP